MTLKRCEFCGKYHQKLNDNNRCDACVKEFTFVTSKVIKRFTAIKNLANR